MEDRKLAYEQNRQALEAAWAERIAAFATSAVAEYAQHDEDDWETVRLVASEKVSQRLLDSARWANVTAVDISDLAYEAVEKAITARKQSV